MSAPGCPALPLPDPPLIDAELSLRPWDPADAVALAAAWADPEIAGWTGVPGVHDLAAARRWIDGDAARRQRGLSLDLVAVVDRAVVGEVGLTSIDPAAGQAELGWWLGADHRGRGLATRAVRLFATWALEELCVDRLVAACHRDNPSSGAVARRAGFDGPVSGREGIDLWVAPGRVSA